MRVRNIFLKEVGSYNTIKERIGLNECGEVMTGTQTCGGFLNRRKNSETAFRLRK